MNELITDWKSVASAMEEMQENLKCAICMSVFKNPVALPCKHMFCENCHKGMFADPANRKVACPFGCSREVKYGQREKDDAGTIGEMSTLFRELHGLLAADCGFENLTQVEAPPEIPLGIAARRGRASLHVPSVPSSRASRGNARSVTPPPMAASASSSAKAGKSKSPARNNNASVKDRHNDDRKTSTNTSSSTSGDYQYYAPGDDDDDDKVLVAPSSVSSTPTAAAAALSSSVASSSDAVPMSNDDDNNTNDDNDDNDNKKKKVNGKKATKPEKAAAAAKTPKSKAKQKSSAKDTKESTPSTTVPAASSSSSVRRSGHHTRSSSDDITPSTIPVTKKDDPSPAAKVTPPPASSLSSSNVMDTKSDDDDKRASGRQKWRQNRLASPAKNDRPSSSLSSTTIAAASSSSDSVTANKEGKEKWRKNSADRKEKAKQSSNVASPVNDTNTSNGDQQPVGRRTRSTSITSISSRTNSKDIPVPSASPSSTVASSTPSSTVSSSSSSSASSLDEETAATRLTARRARRTASDAMSLGGGHGHGHGGTESQWPQLGTAMDAMTSEAAGPDERCSVCRQDRCAENRHTIIFCDGCDVCVHQTCYGIKEIPAGEWFCTPCAVQRGEYSKLGVPQTEKWKASLKDVGKQMPQATTPVPRMRRRNSRSSPPDDANLWTANDVRCCVCPNLSDRAYAPTTDGRWIHVSCALWHTGPEFVHAKARKPVDLTTEIDPKRMAMTCMICNEVGACKQCSFPGCFVSYHVPCGLRSDHKFLLLTESDDTKGSAHDDDDTIYFHSLCPEHKDGVDSIVRNNHIKPKRGAKKKANTPASSSSAAAAASSSSSDSKRTSRDASDDDNDDKPKAKSKKEKKDRKSASSSPVAAAATTPAKKGKTASRKSASSPVAPAAAVTPSSSARGRSKKKRSASRSPPRDTDTPAAAATTSSEKKSALSRRTSSTIRASKRNRHDEEDDGDIGAAMAASIDDNDTSSHEAKRVDAIILLTGGLTPEQRIQWEKFKKLRHVRLTDVYDQATTTHVLCSKVMFKDGEARGSRTLKYMLGVVGGQWVLAWDWVEASVKQRKLLPEEGFMLTGDLKHSGGPQAARHSTNRLFHGCQFYLDGAFDGERRPGGPTKVQLEELIIAAGATLVTTQSALWSAANARVTTTPIATPTRGRRSAAAAAAASSSGTPIGRRSRHATGQIAGTAGGPIVLYDAPAPVEGQYKRAGFMTDDNAKCYAVNNCERALVARCRTDTVPMVTLDWLFDCVSRFIILPFPPIIEK